MSGSSKINPISAFILVIKVVALEVKTGGL